jgi:hypothetical protein
MTPGTQPSQLLQDHLSSLAPPKCLIVDSEGLCDVFSPLDTGCPETPVLAIVSSSDADYLVTANALDDMLGMSTAPGPLIEDPVSSFTSYINDDIPEVPTTPPPPCSPVNEPHQALYTMHSLDVS